jgi:hypothetical protein
MLPYTPVMDLPLARSKYPTVTLSNAGYFLPPSTPKWSLTPVVSTEAIVKAYNLYRHSVVPKTFRDALAATDMLSTTMQEMPKQNRTYSSKVPQDIIDFSRCLMTGSDIRTKATLDLSQGLTLKSRSGFRSRKNPETAFPEGGLLPRPVPAKRLADITNTLHPRDKGILGTDTVFSGNPTSPMAQICADLGSKLVDVFEMPRRTHVPEQIDRFCTRWWSPLVLLSDGAAECKGVAMQAVCTRRDIHQIFRTPGQTKVAVQNFAEAAIGHVTRMATFALVFSGATIRYWFLALEAACFVDRTSAHWYEDISAHSTPYFRIYGQHFPDAGVLKPWGCAALVLLPGDLLSKFKPRTVKMVFVSYAPQYPTYTYGFLNCTTGRVSPTLRTLFFYTRSFRFAMPAVV